MGDPFALFAAAGESKQETLKIVWPELYNLLAKLDGPVVERVVLCAIYKTHDIDDGRRPAVARLTEGGPPACAECVAKAARRPGGFPLKREV
jgi:hypothetical protein